MDPSLLSFLGLLIALLQALLSGDFGALLALFGV